jgi:lysozyme family protein
MTRAAMFAAVRPYAPGGRFTPEMVKAGDAFADALGLPREESNAPLTPDARFRRCLAETLKHEGGWADHPKDPGGATMKGVTLATFRAFKDRDVTKAELRAISDADLEAIYRTGYWDKTRCDDLPAGVDLMVFDLAVNSGPGRAIKFLQAAVNAEADGIIGPATLANVATLPPAEIVIRLRNRRERFFRSLSTFDTFGRGWLRRLAEVSDLADRWARP